jgi:hypothetical protein
MKEVSIIQMFIFIFFISCSNNKKTTNIKTIKEAKENTIGFIEKGLFVGLIGNDSVFIKSETIENNWQINPVVYLGNDTLYTVIDKNIFSISHSDIKIIQLKSQNIAYILLTRIDLPSDDKWFILKIYNKKVKGTYTAIKQILNDIDNDGFFEIGGRELTDAVCLDCDSL